MFTTREGSTDRQSERGPRPATLHRIGRVVLCVVENSTTLSIGRVVLFVVLFALATNSITLPIGKPVQGRAVPINKVEEDHIQPYGHEPHG